MTLKNYTDGSVLYAANLNSSLIEAYAQNGLSLIRQLIAGTVTFSAGNLDWWGDAYVSSAGRQSSVNTGYAITTGIFNTNQYVPAITDTASGDTTSNPDTYLNPSNAFDGDDSTYASKTTSFGGDGSVTTQLGKTFAAKTVVWAYYKARITSSSNYALGGDACYILLQTYDGASWNTVSTMYSSINPHPVDITVNGYFLVNSSIQGIRIQCHTSHNNSTPSTDVHYIYTLKYGSVPITSTIVQTIPTGTFPAGITTAIGVPSIANWETGADIKYKLSNGSDDSGWLSSSNSPIISTFTAFASQPTTLTIQLIPKVSSPTVNYPAVYGFAVRAS